ncbi:MAG: STN domain-containing protein [Parabacteroides sp.]|nr:STN domain-containing protein [Parabacteroides sp.]
MRISFFMLFVTLFQAVAVESYSQTKMVTVEANQISLNNLFSIIEKQSEFLFFYVDEDVDNVYVNVRMKNNKVDNILSEALRGTNLSYTINDRNVNIYKATPASQQRLTKLLVKSLIRTVKLLLEPTLL